MAAFGLFRALPLDWASGLGGWLARRVGPRLKRLHQRGRDNLARAFPDLPAADIDRLMEGVWDNLGRVAGEFPHLAEITATGPDPRLEVVGAENIDLLRDDGRPGLFFSAHLGNWEVGGLAGRLRGIAITYVYREANNPVVERLYRRARADVADEFIPKGPTGAKRALEVLKSGGHLGIMIDQKMNDGIPVPFFGRDAMTAPALAQFALRYHCPLVPIRIERLNGARFRVTAYPPLAIAPTGDRRADTAVLMAAVNATVEDWVRARPEQWLWLHKRWPDV